MPTLMRVAIAVAWMTFLIDLPALPQLSSNVSGIAPGTTPYVDWGDGFIDIDNSGWLGFFLVNGHVYPQVDSLVAGAKYREPKLLYLNQHDGTFKDVSKLVGQAIQIPQVSRGVAMGDLFNDGRIDIVIENLKGSPMILQPQAGPANHGIGFELEGTDSNRIALNADLRIHFGLGNRDTVEKVEIFWPTGKTEILTNLGANHFYHLKEGRGIVPAETSRPTLPKHP